MTSIDFPFLTFSRKNHQITGKKNKKTYHEKLPHPTDPTAGASFPKITSCKATMAFSLQRSNDLLPTKPIPKPASANSNVPPPQG